MTRTKRLLVLTGATAIMAVTVCGCSLFKTRIIDETVNQMGKENTTLPVATTTATAVTVTDIQIETTVNPAKAEDMAKLESLFNDVKNLTPGTAGSSLKTIIVSASLLDFCSTTSLDKSEASGLAMEYMLSLTAAEKEVWYEQIDSLKNTCEQLRTDRATDMLDAAGVTDSLSPWSDLNEEVYNAIITELSK